MNLGSVELHSDTASAAMSMKHGNPKLVIADSDVDSSSSPSSHYPLKPTLLGTSALLKKRTPMMVKESSIVKLSVKDRANEGEKTTVHEKKTRRKKKWKKPSDKPNRPLSAYNLFFAEARAKMLGDDAPSPQQEALKKRVHCKTHGKIGFAVMARTIGAQWKALEADKKKVFEEKATREKDRYLAELASWKEAQKNKQEPERASETSLGLDAIASAAMVSNPINAAGKASFHGETRTQQNMSTNMTMISPSIQGPKYSSDSMRLLLESSMQRRNIARLHVPPQAEYIRAMQDRPVDQAITHGLSAAHHRQHPRNQQMPGGGTPSADGSYLSASEESANAILNHFQNRMPSSTPSLRHNLPSAASGHQMSLPSQASLFDSESFQQFAAMRRLQQRYLASGMVSRGMTSPGGGFGVNGSMCGMNGIMGGMNNSMNGMNGGMNGGKRGMDSFQKTK